MRKTKTEDTIVTARLRVFVVALGLLALMLFGALCLQAQFLVPSFNTQSVLRCDATSGAFIDAFVPSGGGGLFAPTAVTFGPDGNLYVGDLLNGGVLQYNGATGMFIGFFTGNSIGTPTNLVFGPDGNLYVSDFLNSAIWQFNGMTGQFMSTFVAPGTGGLIVAYGLTFGPDGNLYVGSYFGNSVLRYNGTNGTFMDAFVPAGSGGLAGPFGLTFGPDGNLYVASYFGNSVLRYKGTTGAFIDPLWPQAPAGCLAPWESHLAPAACFMSAVLGTATCCAMTASRERF